MTTLFTISTSWHDSHWLYEKLAFAKAGDSILLLQDAVLAAHSPVSLSSFLAKCQSLDVSVHLLSDDADMRGIDSKYADIALIDYSGFVTLVSQYDKQVAW